MLANVKFMHGNFQTFDVLHIRNIMNPPAHNTSLHKGTSEKDMTQRGTCEKGKYKHGTYYNFLTGVSTEMAHLNIKCDSQRNKC